MESKEISKDAVFRLLFINMALVIIGYGMAVLTGEASVLPMRILKYLFLLVSFIVVLRLNSRLLQLIGSYLNTLLTLSLTFLIFSLFTENPTASIFRVLTFIVPFLYISYSIGYLLIKYSVRDTINSFLSGINWVYFIPIVSFFVTGGSLTDSNIYYISAEEEGTAFVSNHYGWSGTIFLVTGIDLLRNVELPFWRKWLIIVTCGIAVYLVLISGNRTSWLSLSLVSLIFLFRYKRISFLSKVIMAAVPVGLVLFLLQDPDSALNSRYKKTQVQSRKGEARTMVRKKMLTYFQANPALFITGIGMFNKDKIHSIINWSGYHNSYFEILFGSGLVVFLFFAYLLIWKPFWVYIRYFSEYYLFLPPLMIIPYFESNLTGGQFLFFPWFIMVVLLAYSTEFSGLSIKLKDLEASGPVH